MIAGRLRAQGHDVLALDEHPDLEGIDDGEVLGLAAAQARVLVTFNVRDFAPILRAWASQGRSHTGCILMVAIRQGDFGLILRRLAAVLESWPAQEDWAERAIFVSRTP